MFPVLAGPDVLDYTFYQTTEHKCRKDILVGRRKHTLTWKLIRPRPTKTLYAGPYYICKGTIYTVRDVWAVSMVFKRLADLRHYRGRRRGALHVSRPLHVCVLRRRDRRVDAGAERIHLQGASVRPLRLQRQHQAERRQDLTGASWHFHVPVRSESSATLREATFSSGVVPVGYNFRTTEQFTKAKRKIHTKHSALSVDFALRRN